MLNSECRIVAALIILLSVAFSQYLNSTILEAELSSIWMPTSSRFATSARCSIVGHDYDNDRVVIFGGINKNKSTGNDTNIYIYDMIQDKLVTIPDALSTYYNHYWEYGGDNYVYTVIYNCGSTNAVIYNNFMYYIDNNGVCKLNLNPFYMYITDSVNTSSVPAILDYIKIGNIHAHNSDLHRRFPVANGCIFMKDLSLYVFYTFNMWSNQTYTIYEQDILVFGTGDWIEEQTQVVQYDIMVPLEAGKGVFGPGEGLFSPDYSCGRTPCNCVMFDDTLYLIGGEKDRVVLVDSAKIPQFDLNNQYYYPAFEASQSYRILNISIAGCSVIKDDEEKYIYLLGGMNNSRQIYKIDTSNISLSGVLNMSLADDIKYSTIISCNKNHRIYAFRGLDGNADQGAFIDISSTLPNTQVTPLPDSEATNQSILGATMEIISGIIFIGLICICGAFIIYRWALKRYPQQSSQENLVENDASENVDRLEMIDHKEIVEENEEKQGVDLISAARMTWSDEMLSEEKLQELYCTYLKSRFNCFHQCEQIGLTHQYIQQLFERFEQT